MYVGDHSETASIDHGTVLQALGLNPQGLIENRAVTSCLPASPIRSTYNPTGSVFNFSYPPQTDTTFESQLIQRLQSLTGYSPPHLQYNYNQPLPYLQPTIYTQPLVNNNYTLQPPPQKKLPPSPLTVRHSYSGSPVLDKRISPARTNDLNNVNFQQTNPNQNFPKTSPTFSSKNQNFPSPNRNFQSNQNYQQQNQNLQQQQQNQNYQQQNQNYQHQNQNYQQQNQNYQQNSRQNLNYQNHLQIQSNSNRQSPQRSPQNDRKEPHFIKPLSQMGTLTTTDIDGRLRVIVPVPANADDASSLLASLKLGEDLRPANVPSITRSTSEKVPNRSELMSQVQRTAWARHTTK